MCRDFARRRINCNATGKFNAIDWRIKKSLAVADAASIQADASSVGHDSYRCVGAKSPRRKDTMGVARRRTPSARKSLIESSE